MGKIATEPDLEAKQNLAYEVVSVDGEGKKKDSNISGIRRVGGIVSRNKRRKTLLVDRGENEENMYQSIEEIMRGKEGERQRDYERDHF